MSIDPQKIKRYALDPNLSLFSELVEANQTLKAIAGEGEKGVQQVEIMGAEVMTIKGAKGDKGDRGERGERGLNGLDGKDGKNGLDGKNGRDGLNGRNGVDGQDGQDGSPDDPEEIVIKINASTRKIQKDRIEGLEDDLKRIEVTASQPRGGGAPGYSLTVQDDGVTVDKFTRFINFTGGTVTRSASGVVTVPLDTGGVGAWSTPPEAVASDGSVTVFTVGATAPTDVVSDGIMLYNGFGYTYAGTQITLDNGPTQYIRYR